MKMTKEGKMFGKTIWMKIFNRNPSKRLLKKSLRKEVASIEKQFYAAFRKEAERGNESYSKWVSEENHYFWEIYLTARYLRRYKLKDLIIDSEEITITNDDKRYIDGFNVRYTW